jgi:acid phosphatase family membrane protein YuiD
VAQFIKFLIKALRGQLDLKYLYASGGMPSVHSAVVTALAVSAYFRAGAQSETFGLAAVLAGIVMYDSFGVRRASGEQAAAINALVEGLAEARVKFERPHQRRLREVLGHTPLEVVVGALLGFVLAVAANAGQLQSELNWLSSAPVGAEFWAYTFSFAGLLLAGWSFKLWQQLVKQTSIIWKEIASRILLKTQLLGWLGLLVSFSQYEKAPLLGMRAWSLLLLASLITWDVYLFAVYQKRLPAALADEQETARRGKWFQRAKKRKR